MELERCERWSIDSGKGPGSLIGATWLESFTGHTFPTKQAVYSTVGATLKDSPPPACQNLNCPVSRLPFFPLYFLTFITKEFSTTTANNSCYCGGNVACSFFFFLFYLNCPFLLRISVYMSPYKEEMKTDLLHFYHHILRAWWRLHKRRELLGSLKRVIL